MTTGWLVLLRPGRGHGTGGWWAGPGAPQRFYDCLAALNVLTRRLGHAPVAVLAAPGRAWRHWYRRPGTASIGRGWRLEILALAAIRGWEHLPPVRPRYRLSERDRHLLPRSTHAGSHLAGRR